MTERPILFSTPMVQAILEGRKTMTRRVVRNIPAEAIEILPIPDKYYKAYSLQNGELLSCTQAFKCPYGQGGDVLWVRETWANLRGMGFSLDDFPNMVAYKADSKEEGLVIAKEFGIKWQPSIFMPKKACRIKLRITNIRVERLNDISEEDAMNEGVTLRENIIKENNPDFTNKYRFAFCLLWESINGKGSWDQNPWVWVIEFERLVCDPVT